MRARAWLGLFLIGVVVLLLTPHVIGSKWYAGLRSECAGRSCRKVDKNNKIKRDMCLHKCISKICYFQTYWDLDRTQPRYTGSESENLERNRRKKDFISCLDELEAQNKTYNWFEPKEPAKTEL